MAIDKITMLDLIVQSNKVDESKELIFILAPELKRLVGFDQKHPHHDLDAWDHTMKAMDELGMTDLESMMAMLFHDISKPVVFVEGEDGVRHYPDHPKVSANMTREILKRIGYKDAFINNVCYLVETHDTPINIEKMDNSMDMIQKRLRIQYADSRAHKKEFVQKRIDFLDRISQDLEEKKNKKVEDDYLK